MDRRDFLEKAGIVGVGLGSGAVIVNSDLPGVRFTTHDELLFNLNGIQHSLICAWDNKLKRVIVLIDDEYINTPSAYQLQRKNKERDEKKHNPNTNVLSAIDAEHNAGLSAEGSGIR